MKAILYILFNLMLIPITYSQNESNKAKFKHTLSLQYVVSDSRVFYKRNNDVKLNYLIKKNNQMLGALASVGYSVYDNNNIVCQSTYRVEGVFAKLGIGLYDEEDRFTGYGNFNMVFSSAKQNISKSYADFVWGTYEDNKTCQDFNVGLEISGGGMLRVYKQLQLIMDVSLGVKLSNNQNPLTTQFIMANGNSRDLPYYTPGMGRGGYIYMNTSLGIGYSF